MASTDRVAKLRQLAAGRSEPSKHRRGRPGGETGLLHDIAGSVGRLEHGFSSVFGGIGQGALGRDLTRVFLDGLFHGLVVWVADGAASLIASLGGALSATTEPVVSGAAWHRELAVMGVLGASLALPLLLLGVIQAVARQELGELLRSALVRLPLALVFTGVAVQLVALGLSATDEASDVVLASAGDPTRHLLVGLVGLLARLGGLHAAGFGVFLVAACAAAVAFALWLELAVRSAAIAAATLFLPLALAGLAWPATAHWSRRLGETLAALVVSKLVVASVLALAAALLGSSSGLDGVVEGVALLAVAALAPFVLLRLVPIAETAAVAHLEGLSRRPVAAARRLPDAAAQVAGTVGGLGEMPSSSGAGTAGGAPAGASALSVVGSGPFGRRAEGDGPGPRLVGWDELVDEAIAETADDGR